MICIILKNIVECLCDNHYKYKGEYFMKTLKAVISSVLIVSCLLSFASCKNTENKAKNDDRKEAAVQKDDSKIAPVDKNDDVTNVTVEDALNYEKKVIVYDVEMSGEDCDFGNHSIKLPKISLKTKNAKEFNEKMYATFSDAYKTLISNNEKQYIYACNYKYSVNEGAIGVAITCLRGVQNGGATGSCVAFYYDAAKDREISFEEYLRINKTSDVELNAAIVNSPEFSEFSSESGFQLDNGQRLKILNCLVDSEKYIVCFEDNISMDGWSELTVKR